MDIEQLEQLAAVIVTAGLVAGNFLLFTPWRDGEDPRRKHREGSVPTSIAQPKGLHDSEASSHSIPLISDQNHC